MKTILVGLDTSERAADVLKTAVDLAELYGAGLSVVRAVGLPAEFPVEALTVSPDGLPARLLEITQKALDKAVAGVPRARLQRVEARLGTPWNVLCDTAAELRADLLVIGTHGRTMLDRVLGTTAGRVVSHAPCSVLVVRAAPAP